MPRDCALERTDATDWQNQSDSGSDFTLVRTLTDPSNYIGMYIITINLGSLFTSLLINVSRALAQDHLYQRIRVPECMVILCALF